MTALHESLAAIANRSSTLVLAFANTSPERDLQLQFQDDDQVLGWKIILPITAYNLYISSRTKTNDYRDFDQALVQNQKRYTTPHDFYNAFGELANRLVAQPLPSGPGQSVQLELRPGEFPETSQEEHG